MGNPIGIGMSNELDSNMALIALLQCFGALHPERAKLGSRSRARARVRRSTSCATFTSDGMTSEVFAWTASSNNDAFLAGRLSLALNAISIARSAELRNVRFNRDIGLLPIPEGRAADGPRARHGRLRDLEVRAGKAGCEEVPGGHRHPVHRALPEQLLLQLPCLPGIGQERAGPARCKQTDYPNELKGRHSVLDPDLEEVDDERRISRLLERRDRRGVQQVPDPADVRAGRQGRDEADEAMRAAHGEISRIFNKWRGRKKI